MKVELWLERFERHLILAGSTAATIRGYRYTARRFLRFLSDRGLNEMHQLRREDVLAYQVSLHHRRKPDGSAMTLASQNREMVGALSFCRFLQKAHYLLVNPAQEIRLMKLPRRLLPKLLDEDEVLTLLRAPDITTPLGLRDRAILELLYSSALRNAELRRLTMGDVDLARLEIRVIEGKGRKSRLVPLGEPAAFWVSEYLRDGRTFLLKGHDPETLFVSHLGKKMAREAVGDLLRKHVAAAGLSLRVTPHHLRHCCATHMLRRQASLRHLQELLGHASAETTQLYTRVEISDLREVHQRCHPRENF